MHYISTIYTYNTISIGTCSDTCSDKLVIYHAHCHQCDTAVLNGALSHGLRFITASEAAQMHSLHCDLPMHS